MIPNQNCEIYASIIFYLIIKIYSLFYKRYYYISDMYNKRQSTLTSIPERNETDEELILKKWVPKKKHEVLKAKYKCLKKLFQIYDASIIGILPETPPEKYEEEGDHVRKKRKRSHRTKTDACAGTREECSGDIAPSDSENQSIATAVMKDLNLNQYSCSTTQIENSNYSKKHEDAECQCQTLNPPIPPYSAVNERPKLTRFQCFIQRLLGIRRDSNQVLLNRHVYAASDNNFNCSFWEKRPRGGLRFRRLRRPKMIKSDGAIKDVNSSIILTYVQSVQRNYLMDTNPRQCPIMGCRMIFYGIINYNDHLNLCHFTDRKFICLYCHEGFDNEPDKLRHENEHIGLSKLNSIALPSSKCSYKRVINTQTDPSIMECEVPEEKLKKIVSFFDKISDPEQIFTEIKKKRCSESNLHRNSKTNMTESSDNSPDKGTLSCVNLDKRMHKSNFTSPTDSELTLKHPSKDYSSPVICRICGKHFNYRRQLNLHVDLEHRVHDKSSKFHSCAGLVNCRPSKRIDMVSTDGHIKVHSLEQSSSTLGEDGTESTLTEDVASRVNVYLLVAFFTTLLLNIFS